MVVGSFIEQARGTAESGSFDNADADVLAEEVATGSTTETRLLRRGRFRKILQWATYGWR